MKDKEFVDRISNLCLYWIFGLIVSLIVIFFVKTFEKEPVSDSREDPPVVVEREETESSLVSEQNEESPVPESYGFDSSTINWDWEYVIRVVAQEAGLTADFLTVEENENRINAQMAVAQCILNTSNATGLTPEEVVKAPNQYAKPYAGEDPGLEMCNESCLRVFANGEKISDEPIRYFYSTDGGFYSSWHENNLTYVTKIGPTKFFK